MFVQDNLRELKATIVDKFPNPGFFVMFIGVVIGPFLVFAIGGHAPNLLGQPALAWSFMAIALLLFISVGGGILMFRRRPQTSEGLSIQAR